MKLSDFLSGITFVVFGIVIIGYGLALPPMPGQRYGAGLFPILLGACAVGGGAAMAWSGWRARPRSGEPLLEFAAWARDPRLRSNFVFTFGLIVAYVVLSERVGFILLSPAMLFALFWRLGVPPVRGALIAVGATAAIYVMFARLLHVPLPRGLLDGIVW